MARNTYKRGAARAVEYRDGALTVLYSYSTVVAVHLEGYGYFRTGEYYSPTTTRHINQWLAARGAHEARTLTGPLGHFAYDPCSAADTLAQALDAIRGKATPAA